MTSNVSSEIVMVAKKKKKKKKNSDKYRGILKLLPVLNKRWLYISIDFIVNLPGNRNL